MNIIGFIMMGVLNKIGLFILKKFGIMFNLLMVCKWVILLCNSRKVSGNVEFMLLISK